MDIQLSPRDVATSEQKLLYMILQELKQINSKLNKEKPIEKKITAKACKYCGEIHENKGQIMACAKKHKKEGAMNDTSN